jgi:hypothetical protein
MALRADQAVPVRGPDAGPDREGRRGQAVQAERRHGRRAQYIASRWISAGRHPRPCASSARTSGSSRGDKEILERIVQLTRRGHGRGRHPPWRRSWSPTARWRTPGRDIRRAIQASGQRSAARAGVVPYVSTPERPRSEDGTAAQDRDGRRRSASRSRTPTRTQAVGLPGCLVRVLPYCPGPFMVFPTRVNCGRPAWRSSASALACAKKAVKTYERGGEIQRVGSGRSDDEDQSDGQRAASSAL